MRVMYQTYYHLKENPFNITADPEFFFQSSQHMEAFSNLLYGIQRRKGIIVVTGEIGTGKTTLCRMLLNRLDEKTKTALILNPNFSDIQLLQLILKDLGISTINKNKFDLITSLNNFLIQQTSQGHNVAIIIDEAQNLKPRQLEQIRLLSNLETEKDKLLQIILVGQPELLEKLKLNSLRQLNQRIAVRFHIKPLEKYEMQNYIYHRLNVARLSREAGPTQPDQPSDEWIRFTDQAFDAIYAISGGTPRVVNILCDRALLAGFAAEARRIDADIINQCAQEILSV